MNRLERHYFINEDGSEDKIIFSINCYEKILYHALRDYDVDYKLVFCDDINLKITENDNIFHFGLNRLHLNDDIFKVNTFIVNNIEKDYLEELLDTGKIVAIHTIFSLLTPYTWHWDNKNRSRNTHYCLLVGYDDRDFYFAEDPTMIKKEYFVPLEDNPTIGRISKEEMLKTLRTFCEIMIVDVNQNKLHSIYKFDEITRQIVRNYNHKSLSYDYGTVYIGRDALNKVIEYTYTNKFKGIKSYLEENQFFIYLLYSRMLIYKWCLEDIESKYNKEYIIEIYKSIQESVYTLQTLRNLIIKHDIEPLKNFDHIVNKWFNRLVKNEDILIESISKIC